MNEDSSDLQSDSRRMSSSFNQGGFFVGSPNNFNMAKWFGDKKMFGGMMKSKQPGQPESPQPVEDFNNVFYPRRARTQSVSSDISVDEQPSGERRSSFSERYFALQVS